MDSENETDWDKLRSMRDADIRAGIDLDSEVHLTDEAFWESAQVVLPSPKKVVTIRLDADLLEWFRRERG